MSETLPRPTNIAEEFKYYLRDCMEKGHAWRDIVYNGNGGINTNPFYSFVVFNGAMIGDPAVRKYNNV